MATGKTIVSYSNIVKPFGDKQTLLSKARLQAGKVVADPAKADALVGKLSEGLNDLQAAQGNYPRILHTPRNMTAALLQTHVAQNAVKENKLVSFVLKGIEFLEEAFEVRFSSDDFIGWMASFFTWVDGIVPAACPRPAAEAAPVPNDFRIAILGDWGTGLYGAQPCAQSIAADKAGYDLLLHLGDVYYSGLQEEIQTRFLNLWPHNGSAISRSLNGNHEMYTGGHAYFEFLLPKLQQPSSYFAFQNDYWTLIALDTAYNQDPGGQEGNLDQEQIAWLTKIVAAAGNRKIALFSHHQPFSQLDPNQGPKLIAALQPFLEARRITAWYWGHEHRCVLYDPHPGYGFQGRCVGHGGFPEARADLNSAPYSAQLGSQWRQLPAKANVPGGLFLDGNNLYVPGFETLFEPHGFMRLEFSNERLIEYVRAPDGANLYFKDLGWHLEGSASGQTERRQVNAGARSEKAKLFNAVSDAQVIPAPCGFNALIYTRTLVIRR